MSTQLTWFVVELREAIRAVIPLLVDLLKDGTLERSIGGSFWSCQAG